MTAVTNFRDRVNRVDQVIVNPQKQHDVESAADAGQLVYRNVLTDLDRRPQQFLREFDTCAGGEVLCRVVGGENARGTAALSKEAPVTIPATDIKDRLSG